MSKLGNTSSRRLSVSSDTSFAGVTSKFGTRLSVIPSRDGNPEGEEESSDREDQGSPFRDINSRTMAQSRLSRTGYHSDTGGILSDPCIIYPSRK